MFKNCVVRAPRESITPLESESECGDYLGVRTNKDFLRLLFFVLLYAAVQNVFPFVLRHL